MTTFNTPFLNKRRYKQERLQYLAKFHRGQLKYLKTTCESVYHYCTTYSHTLTKYSILKESDVQLINQSKVIALLAPLLEHRQQSNSANGHILTCLHTHSSTPTHTQTNTCNNNKKTVLSHVFAPISTIFSFTEDRNNNWKSFIFDEWLI